MQISTRDISLIITFGEQSWIVLTNGAWQPIIDDYIIPDGVTQYTVQLNDISTYENNIFVYINDGWLKVPNSVIQTVSQQEQQSPEESTQTTQAHSSNPTPSQQGDSFFFQTVERTGSELIANSGFDTAPLLVTETKDYQSPQGKDGIAEISVQVDETCSPAGEIYTLLGDVDDVEDGNTVSVLVSDTEGNNITFLVLVIDGSWLVPDADLSTLIDGPLIVSASTNDNSGNSATASTDFIKDTLAEITLSVDTGIDDVINSDEVSQVNISGSVTGVEDGQTISITITDESGSKLEFTALVNENFWQIEQADLTSLSDGQLTYSALVTDTNCNTAQATTNAFNDTKAAITIAVNTSADTPDNVVNAAEASQVDISGTVSNTEDNQTVTVNVTDGVNTLTFNALVTAGTWQVDDADLTSLTDGLLSYTADVNDIAGNLANAETTIGKDTIAGITFDANVDADNVINAVETPQVGLSGTVINIEDKQVITVNVTDGKTTLTFSAIVNAGTWLIENADLSSLLDGPLTYTADVNDIAGNPVTIETSADKDTKAEITVAIDSGGDEFLLANEITPVKVSGTVTNIEEGQTVTVVLSNNRGDTSTITTTVNADLTWFASIDLSTFDDGTLTVLATASDLAGNIATDNDSAQIDTSDGISLFVNTFQDTFDYVINAAEVGQVDILGLVHNVEDGQTIMVAVSDGSTTLSFSTSVTGLLWSIPNVDLTVLNDGALTFNAEVSDVAGNVTSSTKIKQKDTQADITITIDTDEDTTDTVINAAEVNQVEIKGTVTNIEDNQTVTISVTDDVNTLTFTSLISNGTWFINDADLSSLLDGTLTYTADVSDVAGNPATVVATTDKDTKAGITVLIDSGNDEFLLADEINPINISGTVTNIEAGQMVTIVLSNSSGDTNTITTSVNADLTWFTSVDISTFDDGALSAVASVNDVAGNPATANDSALIDTSDGISLFVNTFEDTFDYVINAAEVGQVDILGVIRQVEDGQTIMVTVSDGSSTLSYSTVVNGLKWSIPDVDLSVLSDGALTFNAQASDLAGNVTSSTKVKQKDTQADITIKVDTNGDTTDSIINAAEANQVEIAGTVTNVEDNQTVTIKVTDGFNILTFTSLVSAGTWLVNNADLSSLTDGTLTYTAEVIDVAGNPAISETTTGKDTEATITIAVNTSGDTSDNVVNLAEVNQVDISGTVTNIENNQTVTIKVTDGVNTLMFTSFVSAGTWLVNDADLSSLTDGTLTYTADVIDVAGNPATSATTTDKDTQAAITIAVNTNADTSDNVLNLAEVNQVDISGTVTNIENNQTVTIKVTDGVNTLMFTSLVSAGTWLVNDADLSSLTDGTLTYTADVIDVAGNPATSATTTGKDTQAAITIAVNTNADTSDNMLNLAEVNQVDISGTVTNIENNQTVTIKVTDGVNTLMFTSLVSVGTWLVNDADLSSLTDGTLTYTADVIDVAGNPATSATTTDKDTQAAITIAVNTNADTSDNVVNLAEVNQIDISGTVTNVENNQNVTVKVTDGINTLTFTSLVSVGTWLVNDADLTSLTDGTLTYTADVIDVAGNPATTATTTGKDTQAAITIAVNTNANAIDNVINATEENQVDISGTVTNIENNQKVTVKVTDGVNTLTFTSLISAGTWLVNDADLSTLTDTTLTYTASVHDVAGNPATIETITGKDTEAEITVVIDSGDDEFLLANEINPVNISGTVTNIEEGQTVTVALSNSSGDKSTITTTVNADLTWFTSVDISAFNEGTLTAQVTANDLAGNLATNTDTALIDTLVAIDIDTGPNGLDITEFRANNISQFEGFTSAEIGQTVTLTITDGIRTLDFIGVVDVANHWVVTGIDIAGLNTSAPWQVTSSVSDLAGNLATDDMPIIDSIRTNVLSEIIVAIIGSQSDSQVLGINNAAVTKDSKITLSASQSELDKITSQGDNVTVLVADDGQSLTLIRDSDNELVMKIQLLLSSIKVTLYEAVDNPGEVNGVLNTFATIIAVQTDEDGTTETITLPTKIEIYDSPPLAIKDNYSVIENETSVGSLTGNDFTAEGPLKVNLVTLNGIDYVVPNNNSTTISLVYGELTIDTFGSWSFIASDSLDNTISQEFSLTYQVIDDDGSLSSALATFTIEDGKAGVMNDFNFISVESDIDAFINETFNFTINAGSDALLADSIIFDSQTIDKLTALALVSNGKLLTYSTSIDGSGITGQVENIDVFTLSLTAVTSGNDLAATLSYQQTAPFDHVFNDNFSLPLTVTAQDLDGTTIESGKILLQINDGNNPQFSAIEQISVDEANLSAGEQVVTGVMSTLIGSDEITSVIFNNSTSQPRLTADGVNVVYQISDDGKTLTGFTEDINTPIFVAQLSHNFNGSADTLNENYTFTLYRTLDQNISDQIPLGIKITDFDGDTTTDNLMITVIDDASAQITPPDLLVSEIPADFSNAINIALGNIFITAGTDTLVELDYNVINDAPVLDSNGDAITQDGKAITWLNLDNGTLQGKLADGTVVLTVVVPENFVESALSEPVIFTLRGPIDHLSPQADSLTILVPLVLIDQDGTRIVENMNVQIDDGINPVIVTPGTADLVDEGLLLVNNTVSTSGTYIINSGSDNVVRVVVADGYNFDGVTTRGGVNVSLAVSADSNGWFIATDDGNNNEVFRIRFNTNNTYEYKQSQALDHAIADGENQLTLNFDIQAIDADGDKSIAQSLSVNIKDDIPEATTITVEFAEGDDIALELLSDKNSGADGAVVSKITYNSIDYTVGQTIILIDDEDAEKYAELVVNADGSATINSNRFEYPLEVLNDSVTFETTDLDGDTVTNTLNLIIRDGAGVIIGNDYTTNEDTPVTINIIANPGDTDEGEVITEIRINILSLNGGSITLAGMIIPDDGTDYILSGDLIKGSLFNTTIPNGDLVFTPALNTSDAISLQQVTLEISVQIEESNGTKKPLIFSTENIVINSVADVPVWDDANSTYDYNSANNDSIIEDGEAIALMLKADLFDIDSSEQLTFRIENIDANLILTYFDGTQKTVTDGSILTQVQLATLTSATVLNSSGLMTFSITAIATEQDNGDFIELPAKLISINVQAVADDPDVTVKNIKSNEDVAINVNDIISGQLNDMDGSEILSYQLTLPNGWTLNGANGAVVNDLGSNVWSVLATDVTANNIELIPLADVSSVDNNFTIDVQAISSDSETDGILVSGDEGTSVIKTLSVILKGVIDPPKLADTTNWDFDPGSLTITNSLTNVLNEDTLIPLDFTIVTTDDDSSEFISLTITGFPEGASLVDSSGADAKLTVVGFDNGLPVYSVTSLELQNLYLQPTEDFSGKVSLLINAITTEPDGASGEYLLSLDINISPVIDENSASLSTTSNGIEDVGVVINFKSILSIDIDSSEVISNATITDLPADTILTLDGSAYAFMGSLNLDILAKSLGVSLEDFLSSGRLAIVPPFDATGIYTIPIEYSIVDISPQGDFDSEIITAAINIAVEADVDSLTRFEIANTVLESNNGDPIDLTNIVGFTDADTDGSEVLDYIVLIMPSGDNWLVTHPNGALPDGSGKWLIPINNNLTNDMFQENNVDILAGVSIISKVPTIGPVVITVAGRVIDQTDADIIFSEFEVQFNGVVNSDASAVNDLQLTTIDGIEDSAVSFTGHLDNNIAGDDNDLISFRVLSADLPNGVTLSGNGVKIIHQGDGTTINEYLFTQASLSSLTISSAGDDFAGVLELPIRIIATDTLSGDTVIDDSQILTLDISPVVDGVNFSNDTPMQEDVPESLNLDLNFNDTDLLPSLGGSESIQIDSDADNNLTITLLDGGTLIDATGYFILKSGTTDTWQFTGSTQRQMNNALASLNVQPIEHLAGDGIFNIQFSGNVIDTATMLAGQISATESFSNVVSVDVEAVTDPANLTVVYSEGYEDTPIDLSALSAQLIDQDGSEEIYLTIQGVPSGAILATDPDGINGTAPMPLANNGEDGGSFDGKPTYSWTVNQSQLNSLVLIPQLDFNGDIPLTLQAITKDESPGEYVNSSASFTVGVKPVSDGVDVFAEPDSLYSQGENDVLTIDLGAISTDTNGVEQLQIKVHIDASSDPSALVNIDFRARIEVGTANARFVSDGAGGFIATLDINSNEISAFDLYLGNLAWGTFNMSVDVASVDTTIVNGSEVTDISPIESFNFDVELSPEVDAPTWLTFDDIAVSSPDNIPLNLDIALQNPAPGEEGFLKISGLLPGLTLNNGSLQGNDWIVALDDVASLEVIGASDGDNFDLVLTPYAKLDGEREDGTRHTINIDVDINNVNSPPPALMEFMQPMNADNTFIADGDSFVNNLLDDMTHQTQGTDTW